MTATRSRLAGMVVAPCIIGVVLLGCASLDRPRAQGETVALPTPIRSFDPAVSDAVAALAAAMTAVGSRLDVPAAAYRPSEPQSLQQVPRAVLRADLADPEEGYVVIYRALDTPGAASLAADLAAYLRSGLGLTNFPADTRFSVALLGDTVVFTSWSPGRSSDRERSEAVFEALASVGQPVEIVR